ncbi:MAG: YaaR family protein [Oscillospiraceae bacterium]|nr:YaaR family protein [Oscillospiraceae bacterium]
MKISEFNRGVRPSAQPAPVGEPHIEAPRQGAFREVMRGIDHANASEVLTQLSRDIVRQGEVLAQRYDIAELKRYKKMLAEFMAEAVRFSYEFSKRPSRDGRGRHHIYAVVKRIDEKLEKITRDILGNQVDQIQLIADISDINGMLVDLLA